MVYTEVQVKQGKKYYYRTLTKRENGKFIKKRVYLGTELNTDELIEKEIDADLIIKSQAKIRRYSKEDKLKRIYRTKWLVYHNRASLIPVLTGGSLFDVFSTNLKPLFGDSYNQLVMIYSENKTYACFPLDKVKSLGVIAFSQLKENPEIIKEKISQFREKANNFLDEMKKMSKKFDEDINPKKIIEFYNKYYKDYEEVAILGEPFPLVVHDELFNYLENLLKKHFSDKRKISEVLTILVSPRELSFINRSERDLLDIANRINKNEKFAGLFSLSTYSILDKIKDYDEIDSLISEHTKKYFWVSYDYIGEVLDKKYFITRLKEILQNPQSLKKNFDKEVESLIKKQEETFNELSDKKILSDFDKNMFLAAQQSTTLMDLKKEKLSQAHYYINLLLDIAARKLNVTLRELVFSTKSEFSQLLNNKFKIKNLKIRADKSVFYNSDWGEAIFTEKEASDIIKFVLKESNENIKEVSGICANPGTIIGKVKILRDPKEISKLNQGDIIVTGMTTPEYVSAMKKAGAIVTDEGSITCHAAIVSRELGIPCIVGTKIATKILHDNDIVEIHASTGAIKIIKKG